MLHHFSAAGEIYSISFISQDIFWNAEWPALVAFQSFSRQLKNSTVHHFPAAKDQAIMPGTIFEKERFRILDI
jgi:hypothetical protein